MTPGPFQILVVDFEDPNFQGEIGDELERLEAAGILRVLDLAFVSKSHDGEVNAGMTHQVHSGSMVRLMLGIDEAPGASDDVDLWDAAAAIEPGHAAAVVVLEHLWATPLRDAIVRTGGRQAGSQWVDADYLAGLGVTLV
jgi:hypothetical protein